MPVFATQANIQTTGASVLPIGANGSGKSKLMTAAEIRSAASVYSQAQADAAFVSLAGSYSNPAWITSLANTKITGLGTLATQNGTFSGTSSGTNTGDNAVNSLYSGLVSNATHTGDATGDTALTLATVNSNVGSFGSGSLVPVITVNAKGLITAISTTAVSGGGGGITSINGNSTAAQLLTVGSAGTDFAIDSVTTAGTSVFNIPDASATARGLITTGTQTIAGAKTFSGNILPTTTATYTLGNTSFRWTTIWASTSVIAPTLWLGSLQSQLTADATAVVVMAGSSGERLSQLKIGSAGGVNWYFPADNIIEQRNSTNAQTFRVYSTYTSGTSLELLQARGVASANFEFGPMKGSAGGTLRGLTIGGYATESAAITPWLTFTNAGVATFGGVQVMPVTNDGTNLGSTAARFNTAFVNTYGSDGNQTLVMSNGTFTFSSGASQICTMHYQNGFAYTQIASTSGTKTAFTLTGAAHTTLTASTEATDVNFNLARTVQFATGALTTQRAMRIQAPTYSFVGASTIGFVATLDVAPPIAGTNATFTASAAIRAKGAIALGDGTETTSTATSLDLYTNASTRSAYIKGGVNARGYLGQVFNNAAWSNDGLTITGNSTTAAFQWVSNLQTDSWTITARLLSPSSGVVALSNGTTAQAFQVCGTYTSATSYELLEIKGKAGANFEIGPENGSAGGTLRGLTLGGYSAGSSTITPWLSFTSGGDATFSAGALFSHANGITSSTSMWVSTFGANGGFRSLRANGTSSAPTQVLTGDILGFYSARGYHSGGAYHTNDGGYFGFTAAEDFTSGAQGTTFALQTTTAGAATPTERLFIDSAGVAVFAGEVRVPTASPGTNTTQAASTAFVTAAVAAGGGGITAAKVLSYSLLRR